MGTDLEPVIDDGVDWSDDTACSENQFHLVSPIANRGYHKGAEGEPDADACIRADKEIGGEYIGTQQCCYSKSGGTFNFLEPGLLSAGTPDKRKFLNVEVEVNGLCVTLLPPHEPVH